jgi:hypothetical protein
MCECVLCVVACCWLKSQIEEEVEEDHQGTREQAKQGIIIIQL